MVFCSKCGAENVDTARFCNMCGTGVAKAGEPGGPLVDDPGTEGKARETPEVAVIENKQLGNESTTLSGTLVGHGEVDRAKVMAHAAAATDPVAVSGPQPSIEPEPADKDEAKPKKRRKSKTKTKGAAGAKREAKEEAREAEKPEPDSKSENAAAVVVAGAGTNAEPNVWDRPSEPMNVSTVSLSAMGVRSPTKAWGILVAVALLFVAIGAAGMWFAMRPSEVEVRADATDVPEPDETEDDEIPVDAPVVEVDESSEAVATSDSPRRPRTSQSPRTPRTRNGSGSTSGSGSGPSAESGSSAGSGTSAGSGSGSSAGSGSGSSAGSGSGSGSTSGSGSGSESGSTSTSTSASGSEPDWESMGEEQDLEMQQYSGRVQRFIATYYNRRASGCFDRESRNFENLRGTVVVGFQIQADGEVSGANVTRNTTGSDTVGLCLVGQVNRWRLPPPPEGEAPLAMAMPFRR